MTLHFRCRICSEVLDVERRETCSNACAQALRAHRRPRSERRASRQRARDVPVLVRLKQRPHPHLARGPLDDHVVTAGEVSPW